MLPWMLPVEMVAWACAGAEASKTAPADTTNKARNTNADPVLRIFKEATPALWSNCNEEMAFTSATRVSFRSRSWAPPLIQPDHVDFFPKAERNAWAPASTTSWHVEIAIALPGLNAG